MLACSDVGVQLVLLEDELNGHRVADIGIDDQNVAPRFDLLLLEEGNSRLVPSLLNYLELLKYNVSVILVFKLAALPNLDVTFSFLLLVARDEDIVLQVYGPKVVSLS